MGYFITGCIVFIIALMFGTIKFDQYECKEHAKIMKIEYNWGLTTGCMVKVIDTWMPIESVYATTVVR